MAKLHDINSQLVEDQGFLDLLKDLLSDSIPMVVANAVAALAEIGEVSPSGRYTLQSPYILVWCVCTCRLVVERRCVHADVATQLQNASSHIWHPGYSGLQCLLCELQ